MKKRIVCMLLAMLLLVSQVPATVTVSAATGQTGEATAADSVNVTVSVTSNYINVRKAAGAGPTNPVVAKVSYGEKLTITQVTTVGSGKWGLCEQGWVALMYTDYEMVLKKDEVAGLTPVASAQVNCSSTVNVREGAGTNYPVVGKLNNADQVYIYDIQNVGGHQWGRIEGGWLCLDYAILSNDLLGSATPEQTPEETEPATPDTNVSLEDVIYHGTVVHDYVNIRSGASAGEGYLGRLLRGDKIDIYEIKTVNGRKWGRFCKGWVCLDYVTVTEATQGTENKDTTTENGNTNNNTDTNTGNTVTAGTLYIGIVSHDYVNIRQGTNAATKLLGKLSRGEQIEILEIQTVHGHKWGRFEKGWVCLDYVTLSDAVVDDTPGADTETTPETKPETDTPLPEGALSGTVANTDVLNVRKAAGTQNPKVGSLTRGTKVTVYEQTTVNNAVWGRIGDGQWVAMKYIQLDAVSNGTTGDNGNSENDGSNTVIPNIPNAGGIYATGYVNSTVSLTVRSGPGTEYSKVGTLDPGTEVVIYEQQLKGGMIWGRVGDDQWVCQSYITMLSTGTNGTGVMGTVVRTGYAVNVRSSPGTGSALLGKILVGSRVEIYEQVPYGGTYWGRVNQGWISMDYVLLDSELPEGGIPGLEDNTGNSLGGTGTVIPTTPTVPTTPATGGTGEILYTGKVILTNTLRVRANASTASTELGKLKLGQSVNIYETKISESMAWGKCDSGWICLTYVDLQSTQTGVVDARVVWKESLSIHKSANTNSEVLGTYAKGAVVDILELDGNWARTGDGWVNVSNLLA